MHLSWYSPPHSSPLWSMCANNVRMNVFSTRGDASMRKSSDTSLPAACPLCSPLRPSDCSCKQLRVGRILRHFASAVSCISHFVPWSFSATNMWETCRNLRALEQTWICKRVNAPWGNFWVLGPKAPGLSPPGTPRSIVTIIDIISATQKFLQIILKLDIKLKWFLICLQPLLKSKRSWLPQEKILMNAKLCKKNIRRFFEPVKPIHDLQPGLHDPSWLNLKRL